VKEKNGKTKTEMAGKFEEDVPEMKMTIWRRMSIIK
jgi:hypothetical protein